MWPERSISPDWYRLGVSPKWAPTAREWAKRPGSSTALLNARAMIGPTPGAVISRRQTASSRTVRSTWRCSSLAWRRSAAPGGSIGSAIALSAGEPPASSRTRPSNPALPVVASLRPKLRRSPRRLKPTSLAWRIRSWRADRRALASCAGSDLTCTARYQPVRTACAMPRASLRSVLLGMALRVAFRCRVSRQTTGRPSPVRPACSHCERGPASRPTRTSGPGAAARALAKLSGSLATLVSRTIVPFSSRMQRLLASNDTSIAAKYSTAVASGAAWGRSRTPPRPLVGGQPPRCQPVARPARLPDLDQPGGALLHPQPPAQLDRADPALALRQVVDGLEPGRERQLGVLEHGAGGERELLLAPVALEDLAGLERAEAAVAAGRAGQPLPPAHREQRLAARRLGAEPLPERGLAQAPHRAPQPVPRCHPAPSPALEPARILDRTGMGVMDNQVFKCLLLFRRGPLRMLRPRHLHRPPERPQRLPAALDRHRGEPQLLRHPRRGLAAAPQPAVGRRVRQAGPQLVEQLRLQDRRSRPVAPSQVAERVRAPGVVAGQQLLDPPHPERGRRGHLGRRVTLRQQPDRLDVPGRAGVRRDAEPLPQLRHAQVSRHLRHASASRKPRLQVTGCVTPQEPSPNTSAGNRIRRLDAVPLEQLDGAPGREVPALAVRGPQLQGGDDLAVALEGCRR